MALTRSHVWQATLCLSLAAIWQTPVDGVSWSDNFDDKNVTDGNPVSWARFPPATGLFLGNYDASSGDYALSAPGEGDNNQLVTWVDSANFANNVYIRAQGVILPGPLPEETGGNLALLGRLDPNSVSGYVLYVDSGGNFGLQISVGGSLLDLTPNVDLPGFNATSDIIIELNIIGSELSGFAWQPGQPRPTEPQIVASDSMFPSGKAGIAYDEDDDNTIGVFKSVEARDTPFPTVAPGDFDQDADVDGNDFLVWQRGLGTTFTSAELAVWKSQFPAAPVAASSSSIPEPAAMGLAVTAVIATIAARRRHRAA